jgi:dihydrofolate reductase
MVQNSPDGTAGRLVIDLFTTLDGVAQAPGAPDEDTSGGFRFGGWQAPLFDEVVGDSVGASIRDMDALLLGRRTYDIFAAYWPQAEDGPDGDIARRFNRVPKFVASRDTTLQPRWQGTERIGDDLATEVQELRRRYGQINVIGSVNLVQTLLADGLYDELRTWVYPVVLGEGKKVFPDGTAPANLRLSGPAVTSPKGAVLLRYTPASGVPGTGDMSRDDRGL